MFIIGDSVSVMKLDMVMVLVRVIVNLWKSVLVRLFWKVIGVYMVVSVMVIEMIGLISLWVFKIVVFIGFCFL